MHLQIRYIIYLSVLFNKSHLPCDSWGIMDKTEMSSTIILREFPDTWMPAPMAMYHSWHAHLTPSNREGFCHYYWLIEDTKNLYPYAQIHSMCAFPVSYMPAVLYWVKWYQCPNSEKMLNVDRAEGATYRQMAKYWPGRRGEVQAEDQMSVEEQQWYFTSCCRKK